MKYQELLKRAEDMLQEKGIAEYRLDAWYLFEDCFSISKASFFMKCRDEISEADLEKLPVFEQMLARRGERVPLQQILGSQEFMGLTFFVNEHVLIPRQDTETLVEEAVICGKWYQLQGDIRILDLCTGSGCIGISVTHELMKTGKVETLLGDISEEALAVAEQNIRNHSMEHCCKAVHSDLFEKFEGETFQMILSNPPYIPSREVDTLEPEVKDHEPRLALDGMEDGLYYYRRIAAQAGEHLASGGCIFFEIGWDQSEDVEKLLTDAGFVQVRTIRDLCGKDRVVTGRKI